MAADAEARVLAAIHEVLGSDGDETILEYVAGVAGDEHFEWADAFEQIGPLLVDSGCCADDAAARAACEALAAKLDPKRAAAAAAAGSAAPAAGAADGAGGARGGPQALSGGPVRLDAADGGRRLLHDLDAAAMRSGKDLIQATFGAAGDPSTGLSAMTEKDRAKLERRAAKEEAAARAAFEAHAARARSAAAGARPTIVRNA